MARPEKNTVEYFPFYCDDGKKMFYLEETYGNDGFAVFLKILRELAKTDYHYLDLSKKTTLMFLSAKCKVSVEVLESIINDLVDLEKFNAVLWNENKVVWCQDFIDSIQDAYSKRKNKCIDFDGLLLLLNSLGVRKLNKSKSKYTDNTQSILEYSKVDKTIVKETKEKRGDLIFPFESEEFNSQWNHWKIFKKKEFRFNFKSLQSEQAALSKLNTLSNGNEETAIGIIHQSMANGWKGFFALQEKNKPEVQKQQKTVDRIQQNLQGWS